MEHGLESPIDLQGKYFNLRFLCRLVLSKSEEERNRVDSGIAIAKRNTKRGGS